MRNTFHKVDVSDLTAFTAVDLGMAADEVTLLNSSGLVVEVSSDGTTLDIGELISQDGATMHLNRTNPLYNQGAQPGMRTIYLRRQTGSGGGPLYVRVYAEKI